MPKRIGIYGGTFDPVHDAHIQMALTAKEHLSLDELFLVPTRPWQKTARSSDQDRLAMLRIACRDVEKQLKIDTRELDRAGQSYSIDTLYSFRREYGEDTEIFFVMGADQWKNLPTWIQWQHFPLLVNLAVVNRNGVAFIDHYEGKYPVIEDRTADTVQPFGAIYLVDMPEIDLSSSEIRQSLFTDPSRSAPIKGLNPDVQRYIIDHELYLPREGSHRI